MTMPPLVVKQPCGIAHLLAVVTGVSVEKAFTIVGLALCPRCDKAATNPRYYPYCGQPHKGPSKVTPAILVSLRCDECDVLFPRRQCDIMMWARRGGQKIFCGRSCQGKYMGRTYGAPALRIHHPQKKSHCLRGHPLSGPNLYVEPNRNRRHCRACQAQHAQEFATRHRLTPRPPRPPRPPRRGHGHKHDWAAIWKAHQDTGYGEARLSRQLGIPAQSIGNVLRYYRRLAAAEAGP